ncbi:MAG: hypothetical protein J6K96_09715 [Treponema sp.]|nr:hypothetical protein [Treponema sp.]
MCIILTAMNAALLGAAFLLRYLQRKKSKWGQEYRKFKSWKKKQQKKIKSAGTVTVITFFCASEKEFSKRLFESEIDFKPDEKK